MKDLFNDKSVQEYLDRFRREVLPKLEESSAVLVIGPEDKDADIKIALEVGFAVLLNKPLIVVKLDGRECSPRLLTIADHVIEGDMGKDAERITAQISEILNNDERIS
jgi:nucleoside 2-deoxyribosyltransferase